MAATVSEGLRSIYKALEVSTNAQVCLALLRRPWLGHIVHKLEPPCRQLLEARLGLKRYEVGEIASRIAQLYYHYYLRTSDTNHLLDSFMFYNAVRERAYFAHVADDNRCVNLTPWITFLTRGLPTVGDYNREKLRCAIHGIS
jgi:hypothetical protein